MSLTIDVGALTGFLQGWQALTGAAVGGVMGFVGAYVVASTAARRERRNAARLMLMDVSLLESRYTRIKALSQSVDTLYQDWLPEELLLERHELSPQFATQAVLVLDVSLVLSIVLSLFTATSRQMGDYLRVIEAERRRPNEVKSLRERDLLANNFEDLHAQCRYLKYLLVPLALTFRRRVIAKLRRRFKPSDEEREVQKGLAEIRKTGRGNGPI